MNMSELRNIVAELDPGKIISVLDPVDIKYHAIRSAYGNFKKNEDYTYTDDIEPAYQNLTLSEIMNILYDFMMKGPCFSLYIDGKGYIVSDEEGDEEEDEYL